jgi:hypothetical protein
VFYRFCNQGLVLVVSLCVADVCVPVASLTYITYLDPSATEAGVPQLPFVRW